MGHVALTTPISRMIYHRIDRLGLLMLNLCTKFTVSNFIRHKDTNDGAKCRERGGYVALKFIGDVAIG